MIIKTHRNKLFAYGTIWEGDGRYFVEELARLEKDYAEITVHLHTPGGSVFEGNLIYNALNKSASNIHIVIDGIAASMGAIIILSARKVSMVENGYLMIHAPSSYSKGQAKDFENQAKLLRSIEKNFVEKLTIRTGKPTQEVEKWLQGDNWFDAQEAKKLGLITDIISPKTEALLTIDNPANMQQQEVYNAYANLFTSLENSYKSKTTQQMKSLVIQALALTAVSADSSDTAVVQAIQERLEQEKEAREKAENELSAFKTQQIESVINKAVAEKVIAEEQKEVYRKIAETSGIEALQVVLENTQPEKKQPAPVPDLAELIKNKLKGTVTNASWSFDQWQENDPKGLEKLSVENPEKFKELFNAKYKR